MQGERVLITGHEGFIGKRLIKKISLTGDNFIKGLNEDYLKKSNWKEELNNILDDFNPSVIFHVGACSDTMEKDATYMFTRNYESTKIIAEWTWMNNVPLIYSSSASIYGINGEHPSNLYGWSKYAGEDIVTVNCGISLRYFNVYGPGEEHKNKMASVAYQMFVKYKNKEDIRLFPGNPKRDFVYVDDVVDANLFAYENFNGLDKKYYEVGSGESRTFEYVMNILDIPFSYLDESVITNGYQFNTKSNSELWMPGWKPKNLLETGLTKYKKYLENSL